MKEKTPKGLSFGWQRAQLLGAFFNGVFLLVRPFTFASFDSLFGIEWTDIAATGTRCQYFPTIYRTICVT